VAEDTPFFIVGSGRCGSTLLRLMLCGHSRIHIPPETWFIADLVRELPLTGALAAAQVDRAVEIMTKNYRWPDMRISAEGLRRWARGLDAPKLVDVVNLVYNFHLDSHGKRRFGDKTPPYINYIPEITTLYPGAKFIHLVRDGRDVAISYMEMEDMRFYDRNFYWTRAMRRRRAYLDSPYAGRILEVKYEDLVSHPEPTLHKLCGFLGEKFEREMLDWQQLTELVPERERPIHGKLAEPLRREAVGVWQRKLTRFECFAMESCLQRDLRSLGYQLRFAGAAWRPLLVAFGWLLALMAPLLVRGIPYLQRRKYLPRAGYL
jgi:Sulfotransferase family